MGKLHLVLLAYYERADMSFVLGRRSAAGLELLDFVLAELQLDLAVGSQSLQITRASSRNRRSTPAPRFLLLRQWNR